MRRRGSTARPVGTIPCVQESLVRAKELPLLREERPAAAIYVPATDRRLRRHVLRHQGGREGGTREGIPHQARRFSCQDVAGGSSRRGLGSRFWDGPSGRLVGLVGLRPDE